MKIADVAEFYSESGGGVRTYVREKLRASARLGNETVVIAPGAADREEAVEGGKIVWVKALVLPLDPRYHIFTRAAPVHAVLDRERPDVVEGSSTWRGGWIAATWRGPAARSLVMHQDVVAVYGHTLLGRVLAPERVDRLAWPFWSYLRRLNRGFDTTIVAGEWLAHRLEGYGLQRLRPVPFGVDRAVFQPGARDPEARRAMLAACGLSEEAHLLISVGRHHPEKRLETLIEAVTRTGARRPIGLYLVGDGPTRKAIERRAKSVAHVHVAGHVPGGAGIARLVASADAMLHGSGAETYGLAVAEALCCGTPVIVPGRGGAGDLAGPAYAETYRLGDAKAAAAAIDRLLSRDRAELSDAAFQAAAQRIGSPESHFDRLFALYGELVYAGASRRNHPG